MTDVDGSSILISAGTGALSGGLSTLSKVKNVSKLVQLATSEAGETVIDAGASMISQLNEKGEISVINTVIDATVGKIVGKKVEKLVENRVSK